MPLCDHVRPGSLHRVNRPTEVHAPILIKIIKGGVLEWLASAYTGVVHEKVDSPEMLDGHRDQVTSALRGGNVTVIRDCLASTRPNEVGHLFRYRGVLPEPRYVSPQVVHHDPGTAFGEKFDVCPPQPAACPSHNRDLSLQRNSFGHVAILLSKLVTEHRKQSRTTDKAFLASPSVSQVASMGEVLLRARPLVVDERTLEASLLRRETLQEV